MVVQSDRDFVCNYSENERSQIVNLVFGSFCSVLSVTYEGMIRRNIQMN